MIDVLETMTVECVVPYIVTDVGHNSWLGNENLSVPWEFKEILSGTRSALRNSHITQPSAEKVIGQRNPPFLGILWKRYRVIETR